ncbi:MAG: flavin reductase [Acutalibacteraceae bacterium]|nr:flavin reductase [Acutalibacteraceae bacterium]
MKELSNIREIKENLVKLIADDWALVSAGDKTEWNTMTISWGGIGELWGKDVVFAFIRPQRYTKEFMDKSDYFTVSFFEDEFKDALKICGTKSGRDCDKISMAGLTAECDGAAVFPAQARLVIKCRKIAVQKMDNSGFIDETIESNYKAGDYHFIYIGEIEKILEK